MNAEFLSQADLALVREVASRWQEQAWSFPAAHTGPRATAQATPQPAPAMPIADPEPEAGPDWVIPVEFPVSWPERSAPKRSVAICQDVDVLERMGHDALVADIDDPEFIRYWSGRTGNSLGIDLDGNCGTYENPGDRYQLPGPNARRLLANPPDSSWWVTRGSLNDCWRLYKQDEI